MRRARRNRRTPVGIQSQGFDGVDCHRRLTPGFLRDHGPRLAVDHRLREPPTCRRVRRRTGCQLRAGITYSAEDLATGQIKTLQSLLPLTNRRPGLKAGTKLRRCDRENVSGAPSPGIPQSQCLVGRGSQQSRAVGEKVACHVGRECPGQRSEWAWSAEARTSGSKPLRYKSTSSSSEKTIDHTFPLPMRRSSDTPVSASRISTRSNMSERAIFLPEGERAARRASGKRRASCRMSGCATKPDRPRLWLPRPQCPGMSATAYIP